MNNDTPMCECHEANYIQSRGHQNQTSNDSYCHQSHHEQPQSNNDSEKLLTELVNDVKYDLEDFKSYMRSKRTDHDNLFDKNFGKTTGVLPNKKSKTVNQEPQSKTDLEKSITKFLDGQRLAAHTEQVDSVFTDKTNPPPTQAHTEIEEWSKSQTNRTNPPPPQAHTEQVDAVFTVSGKSDDPPKVQKDPPLLIIVNNKIKKDKPVKTSKRGYNVVKKIQRISIPVSTLLNIHTAIFKSGSFHWNTYCQEILSLR
ncbi:hypothetical protein Tco_0581223 [Tanacetum coccineum]